MNGPAIRRSGYRPGVTRWSWSAVRQSRRSKPRLPACGRAPAQRFPKTRRPERMKSADHRQCESSRAFPDSPAFTARCNCWRPRSPNGSGLPTRISSPHRHCMPLSSTRPAAAWMCVCCCQAPPTSRLSASLHGPDTASCCTRARGSSNSADRCCTPKRSSPITIGREWGRATSTSRACSGITSSTS